MIRATHIVLLGALPLLAPLPAHALDVCRAAETTTDAFEGVQTTSVPTGVGYVDIAPDGGAQFRINISAGGVQPIELLPGWPLQLKLEDGSTVTLFAAEKIMPVGTAYATQYSAGVFTTWRVRTLISQDAATAIAQSRPVAVRYQIADETVSRDLPAPTGNYLSMGFACASQLLQDAAPAD